ncbi:MAG: hypothetical protein WCO65_01770 [bacterium]
MENTNKKLWFRRKTFGWGWYPITWQGWSVIILYVLDLVSNAIFANNHVNSNSDFLMQFFPHYLVLTIFLIIICYATGEKPKWTWGFKK